MILNRLFTYVQNGHSQVGLLLSMINFFLIVYHFSPLVEKIPMWVFAVLFFPSYLVIALITGYFFIKKQYKTEHILHQENNPYLPLQIDQLKLSIEIAKKLNVDPENIERMQKWLEYLQNLR